jgi:dihydroflavonol-4-reductase
MKALVTGATGFIGANLVRRLIEEGFEVRVLVREKSPRSNIMGLDVEIAVGDLNDKASLDAAISGCNVLFHAAASYVFWTRDPAAVYAANVGGTENVLLAALEAGVEKVVYTSTETTIGVPSGGLGRETNVSTIDTLYGDYKKSKLLAEQVALRMCEQGLPVTIVNPTMPLGAWDIKPTPTGQVVVDFLNGRMPAYVNTGLNLIDVDDVARGHLLALEKGKVGERYILGHRNSSLRELLELLGTVTGIKAPSVRIPIGLAVAAGAVDEFVEGRLLRRHPRIPLAAVRTARKIRHFDCAKAVQELGLPQSPIEEALDRAVAWFRQNGYVKTR